MPIRGRLVFVVEDDPMIAGLVVEVLRMHGYEPRQFESAPAALDAISSGDCHPAALITDYQLGGMTGLELIADFHTSQPATATILVSGSVDPELLREASVQPMFFLPKPFSPSELIAALKKLIG